MLAAMPSVFSIDSTHLTITHTASNISDRLSLFGTRNYSFSGTFATSTNDPNFPTSYNFIVDFVDACTTATIVPKTLTFTAVNESDNLTFIF